MSQPHEKHVATHPCLIVTVVRHAETRLNRKGPGGRYMQGQLEEDLTEKGLLQAKALAYRLRKTKFHRIITSDLKQAVQTTSEIEKYQKDAKVTTDIRLREQDLGQLAGKKVPEVQKILKGADNHMDGYLKQHGEPMDKFKTRLLDVYHDVIIDNLVEPHYDFLDKVHESETAKFAAFQSKQLQKSTSSGLNPSTTTKPNPSEPTNVVITPSASPSKTPDSAPAPLLKSKSAPHANEAKQVRAVPALNTGNLSSGSITNMTLSATSPSHRSPTFALPHPLLTPTSPTRMVVETVGEEASATSKPWRHRRPKFPQQNILLVTHGGCIRVLMKHIMTDLGFPVKEPHPGFPKAGSVYQFVINKKFWADGDYEWSGLVLHMNNVAHLADMLKKHGPANEEEKERSKAEAIKNGGRKPKDRAQLPSLPTKSTGYERDTSSDGWSTPNVSPEQPVPPPIPGPKKSLGW